ncbi:hypothetical protein Ddye_017576 [Dipteronia dyeriana]|uniref:Uncharacterized protein n=1 Tax=Dipteronia dyeriana TaxID=168575 RepID=A0AAD9X1A7_9ROSI|nr:hypothetical protein Ddye_017576 [Dipteronia dyeriana]
MCQLPDGVEERAATVVAARINSDVQLALQERDTDNVEVALTRPVTRGALQLMLDSGDVVESRSSEEGECSNLDHVKRIQ